MKITKYLLVFTLLLQEMILADGATMSLGPTPHYEKQLLVNALTRQKGYNADPFEGPYFLTASGLLWRSCPSIWTYSYQGESLFSIKDGQEIWIDRDDYFGSSAALTKEAALAGMGKQICLLGEVDFNKVITLQSFAVYDEKTQWITSDGSIFVERPEVDRLMGADGSKQHKSPQLLAIWKRNDPVLVAIRKHRLPSRESAYKPTIFYLINLRSNEVTAVDKLK